MLLNYFSTAPFLCRVIAFNSRRCFNILKMGKPAKPTADVRYIEPIELSNMMKYLKIHKDFSIIDVRDADFIGGNVVGAINVPSQHFHNHNAGLAERLSSVPKVVFHCALSQARGPKCARIYHSYLTEEALGNENSDDFTQEVMILRGGFTAWQSLFSKDPALTEKYDEELWSLSQS